MWARQKRHHRCCVCRAFDNLRDVRGLEYELDFVTNRANRDLQVSMMRCAVLHTVHINGISILKWSWMMIDQ